MGWRRKSSSHRSEVPNDRSGKALSGEVHMIDCSHAQYAQRRTAERGGRISLVTMTLVALWKAVLSQR